MNRSPLFAFIFACFLILAPSHAQEAIQLPKEPFVAPLQPGTQWSVSLKTNTRNTTSDKVVAPVELRMRVGKNSAVHGEIILSDGTHSDFFVVQGMVLQKFDNSEKIAIFPQDATGLLSLRRADWPGVFWVARENYHGVEEIEGAPCFHFESHGLKGSDFPEDFVLSAWIRVADLKPIRATLGGTTFEFSEISPLSGEVTLPASYLTAWNEHLKRLRVLARLQSGR